MANNVTTTLSPALERALGLLANPPAEPDVSKGYLDLLNAPTTGDAQVAKNTGAIQAAWASPIGSFLYDNAQALTRRFIAAWQLPVDWLDIPPGGIALDVGSGPGSVTTSLAHAAGPGGLALGVDISEPMLARAVRAAAGPQVGFLRADAQRLPLRDETVDAAVSIAVLQLIPDPAATLSEIARVLRPGGRLAVTVPTCVCRLTSGESCLPVGHTCSARTKSATSSKTTASSACVPRASGRSKGCAASAADLAVVRSKAGFRALPRTCRAGRPAA